jgi:hypothetical protein
VGVQRPRHRLSARAGREAPRWYGGPVDGWPVGHLSQDHDAAVLCRTYVLARCADGEVGQRIVCGPFEHCCQSLTEAVAGLAGAGYGGMAVST